MLIESRCIIAAGLFLVSGHPLSSQYLNPLHLTILTSTLKKSAKCHYTLSEWIPITTLPCLALQVSFNLNTKIFKQDHLPHYTNIG